MRLSHGDLSLQKKKRVSQKTKKSASQSRSSQPLYYFVLCVLLFVLLFEYLCLLPQAHWGIFFVLLFSFIFYVLLFEYLCLLPQAQVMKGDLEPGWLYDSASHHQRDVSLRLDGVESN